MVQLSRISDSLVPPSQKARVDAEGLNKTFAEANSELKELDKELGEMIEDHNELPPHNEQELDLKNKTQANLESIGSNRNEIGKTLKSLQEESDLGQKNLEEISKKLNAANAQREELARSIEELDALLERIKDDPNAKELYDKALNDLDQAKMQLQGLKCHCDELETLHQEGTAHLNSLNSSIRETFKLDVPNPPKAQSQLCTIETLYTQSQSINKTSTERLQTCKDLLSNITNAFKALSEKISNVFSKYDQLMLDASSTQEKLNTSKAAIEDYLTPKQTAALT